LVNFAGINNSTAATSTVAHENFLTLTANVTAGQTYPVVLKGNTVGVYITSLSIYFDWNQDADFDDNNESFYIGEISNSTGTDTVTLRKNIKIPSYIRSGTTRMRVVKTYSDGLAAYLPLPCGNPLALYGQAEEYTIQVTSIPQCLTGTKFPSTTLSNLMCDGSNNVVSTQYNTANYFEVVVQQDKEYKIASSRASDYITIANKTATLTYYASTSPNIWKAEVSDTIRVYLHASSTCGTDTLDRLFRISCGLECLNGTLFPTQTFVPTVCDDSTLNIISTSATTGQYSNVQVEKGSDYTFSTGVNTDVITISLDGEYATYKGNSPLYWKSDTTATIRFYANVDDMCNVDTIHRVKSIKCKLLQVPGCVTHLYPDDGDTMYVSVATYNFGFTLPTTGGDIETLTFNVGLDSITAFYVVDFPLITEFQVTFDNTDVNKTYYWWITTSNSAGIATCNPIKHKMRVLARPPVGINTITQGGFSAYPNPVEKYLIIINNTEIDKIEIINMIGQTVATLPVYALNVTVDMDQFPSGIYQIKLTDINKELKVMKVFKR
jgi:hypothetical protein